MPDLSEERALRAAQGLPPDAPVAGVDEVGRGPCAGPVVACAAVLAPGGPPADVADRLDDSKTVPPAWRAHLHDRLIRSAEDGGAALAVALGEASVAEIDAMNVLAAAMLAMRRAVAALPLAPAAVLVDGNRDPGFGLPTRCLVKGDGRSLSVAAASIVAKVARDRAMAALAETHPGYGWETNAGYGTKAHLAALARLGVTPHHRRSFAPVRRALETTSAR